MLIHSDALAISPSVTRALSSPCTGSRPRVITWVLCCRQTSETLRTLCRCLMVNTIPPSTSSEPSSLNDVNIFLTLSLGSGVLRMVLRTAFLKSVMAIPPPVPPLPTSLLPRPPISLHPRPLISLHPRPLISLLLLLLSRSFPLLLIASLSPLLHLRRMTVPLIPRLPPRSESAPTTESLRTEFIPRFPTAIRKIS